MLAISLLAIYIYGTIHAMKTIYFRLVTALAAILLNACGGGSLSPQEAAHLLLEQSAECYAIVARDIDPSTYNRNAALIAEIGQQAVCAAWPENFHGELACAVQYKMHSKPYSGPCVITP